MTLQQELLSWFAPSNKTDASVPPVGSLAPSTSNLPLPREDHKPTLVTFLRHCGCPFAEKTFLQMRLAAQKYPDVHFVAVSHSDQSSTEKWLASIGGRDKVQMVVDADNEIYARWGLGVASLGHIFNIEAFKALYQLASAEKISNRPTESGSRWQTSGTWAINDQGTITWGGPASSAHDIPDIETAVMTLSKSGGPRL